MQTKPARPTGAAAPAHGNAGAAEIKKNPGIPLRGRQDWLAEALLWRSYENLCVSRSY